MNNLFDLKKRFVVVTGGNGFLGKVFCEAISENNGNPIIVDKNINGALEFSSHLNKKYKSNSMVLKCDITKVSNVKKNS